jgi:hypothetical protein
MVARDGIEPPTPAFSGPPTNGPSGLESADPGETKALSAKLIRIIWDHLGCFPSQDVPVLFPPSSSTDHHPKHPGAILTCRWSMLPQISIGSCGILWRFDKAWRQSKSPRSSDLASMSESACSHKSTLIDRRGASMSPVKRLALIMIRRLSPLPTRSQTNHAADT